MLYERWQKISGEFRNEIALRDFASGGRWTFGELLTAGERPAGGSSGAAFPLGNSPDFIIQLLAAWRDGRVVCPLEAGQIQPDFPPPPNHCVHLKFTSATSGAARFIAFTADQLAADAENIVATMGLRREWPNLGTISLAHSYGFSNLILPLLLHGIPLMLVPAPLPEIIRRAADLEKNVTLPAVPAMWRAWHEAGAIPPNLRLAISAGAPLPLPLETEVFQSSGVKIHNFYGASECGGIAYDGAAVPRAEASFAGREMRNVALSLSGNGCLQVHGRSVGQTYWPEPTDALAQAVYRSNDLAELNDGNVFLRGRLGDLIHVAGRKVTPETIERVLLAHPGVRDCLVFGIPSPEAERTETIAAVVVGDASENELKRFLRETLPAWQVPREWHFVDSLSANARGKISRVEWRKRFYDVSRPS
jgi:acyl-coenzyme A synthetase/AMP-(fatty) acid ligase